MSNGIRSLPRYQQGGVTLPDPEEERRQRLWDLMLEHSQNRSEISNWSEKRDWEEQQALAEKTRQRLAFADTLQSITRTSDAQRDIPIQYGSSLSPIRETLLKVAGYPHGASGWYEPELPLKKEEHQLPPFARALPESMIEPLGKLFGLGEERVHLRSPQAANRGTMAHEFGHAFDFRNLISNELENKITEEFWGNMLENETFLEGREGSPYKLWGHTEEFAPAFASAVEYLQEATDPEKLSSPRFHTSDPDDPEGQPVSWKVPSYISTMVQELLKRPAYRNHPFNTSGLPVETWVNPEIVEMRERWAAQTDPDRRAGRSDRLPLLAQQDVTRIRHPDVPDSLPSEASQRMALEREWRESAPRRNELANRITSLYRLESPSVHETEELSRLKEEEAMLEGVRDTPIKRHPPGPFSAAMSNGIRSLGRQGQSR